MALADHCYKARRTPKFCRYIDELDAARAKLPLYRIVGLYVRWHRLPQDVARITRCRSEKLTTANRSGKLFRNLLRNSLPDYVLMTKQIRMLVQI